MVGLMLNCMLESHLMVAWSVNLIVLGGVTWFCLKQILRQSNVGLQALLVKFRLRK